MIQKPDMHILDFHTHCTEATDALISMDPRHFDPQPGLWYSVGFHPWENVDQLNDCDFTLLERSARHPQVLAIGETGLDRLRGPALSVQETLFVRHLQLAADLGKPVVVHSVRTAQEILSIRHRAGLDEVPIAIHGMRGNERVARTLLDAGCYLSFGIRFNPAALAITPLDRLLIETDDALDITIHDVAQAVAAPLNQSIDNMTKTAAGNAQRLLMK